MKKILLAVALFLNQFTHAQQLTLDNQQVINLSITGQYWTFLKYHHPAIATGKYDWDSTLFQLLPAVMAAKNNEALSKTLEQLLDKYPTPSLCVPCEAIANGNYFVKPNYGQLLDGSVLNASLTAKLNYIRDNRNLDSNYYVKKEDLGNPDFSHEKKYVELSQPDIGYKLLALFRYWGIINYFFPYRNEIGQDWNKVLPAMLPEFVQAADAHEYAMAVQKLLTQINDTHAFFLGNNKAIEEWKGKNTVPFNALFIEHQLVIVDLHTDTLDVKAKLMEGDIITAINGRKMETLVKQYLPYTAASNYETKLRLLPKTFLLRSNDASIQLTINRKGKIFTYDAPMVALNPYQWKDSKVMKETAYRLLNDSIGYVFAGRFNNDSLAAMIKAFAGVKGMIIDMRTYPGSFMPYTLGNYLKSKASPFVKFTTAVVSYPGAFEFIEQQGINGDEWETFKGKVVVIVNAGTQSQGEFTTMAFQTADHVTVIGSTTAGADGNVSAIALPGGVGTMISGIGIYYPDNGPTQRVGVRIDKKVYPTIKGIREGRDELLEAALQIVNAK